MSFNKNLSLFGYRVYTTLAVVCVAFSVSGCRSAQRLVSNIHVTEEPTTQVADIAAPEQRLATSKTTVGAPTDGSRVGLASAVAGMPKVFAEKRTESVPETSAPVTRLSSNPRTVPTKPSTTGVQARLSSQRTSPQPPTSTQENGTQLKLSDRSQALPASLARKPTAEMPGKTQVTSQTQATAETKPSPKPSTKAKLSQEALPSQKAETTIDAVAQKTTMPAAARDKQVSSVAKSTSKTPAVSGSLSDLAPVSVRLPESMVVERSKEVDQQSSVAAAKPAPASTKPTPPTRPDSGLVSATMTDLTAKSPQSKSVAAKQTLPGDSVAVASEKSLPPVSRKAVSETHQPMPLDAALRARLTNLPELGTASPGAAGPAPKRIGPQKGPKTAEAEIAVAPVPSIQHPSQRAGDLQVVKPTSGKDTTFSRTEAANPIHMASHSRSLSDRSSETRTAAAILPSDEPPTRELSEAELYDQLLSRISKPVENETPLQRERRLIVARHLMVLAGDPNAATHTMEGLNETEQKYLKNQLMGLWTMIDPKGHPSSGRRITEALPRFREATRYMAAATDSLTLKHLEFCTEIESYGQIKPFEGNRFTAGQQVILYCEVENFAAEPSSGFYQTKLQGTYDIYDDAGKKVVSQLLPVDQQQSRNQLRDYFVAYQMNLPRQLSTGSYRLQLTIEDAVGKKYGQSNIPFEIK